MKSRTSVLIVVAAAAIVVVAVIAARASRPAPASAPTPATAASAADLPIGKRKVQIALLLDTSSSMDGLINQARSQMWKVVNEFARASQQNARPLLEIALYQYGNDGLPRQHGWIQRVLPFTTDLDDLSEKLFALRTNGGEEYCGQVIQTAVRELQWSTNPDDLKMIFIAGNEPFTQGPVPPATAIALARRHGIVVNPIHCGGDEPTWREGARLAGSTFMSINQNQVIAHVAAPQDDEIARLGEQLNNTYLAYGSMGVASKARQAAQSANAKHLGKGASLARSVASASKLYKNAGWDLVDAARDGKDVGKIAEEDMPPEMKKMDAAQRKAHVLAKSGERAQLQKRIAQLNVDREKFVRTDEARRGKATAATLDTALIKTVRTQGKKSGWRFE